MLWKKSKKGGRKGENEGESVFVCGERGRERESEKEREREKKSVGK